MKSIYCTLILLLATAVSSVAQSPASDSKPASTPAPRKQDKAAAYYHYTLAHIYEEQVAVYGRSELANKAIEEYRLAIEADPTSEYLTSALAELYAKTGRIRDAVMEAQDILKRDPNNLEAHKLLGRIYLRSLGDIQAGQGSQNVLKLAIEQYEQIIKIEPDNVDDHLLLGRLYRLNNDLQKAEGEFKTAVKLDPNSEEAVTTLAYLYNEEGDTARAGEVLSSIPDAARSAKLYSALGYTYEQQKQYKNAINAYRKAIELDRDNLDAIRGLAQNLMNDGQTDAALEQYKIIADANPEDAQTYLRMAEIYRKSGKFDQALESLKKAGSMVQDSIEVPYNMAAVYQAQGRYDEAIQVMQDLLKKTEKADNSYTQAEKNNRSVFLERLGTIYRDNKNDTQAVETFNEDDSLWATRTPNAAISRSSIPIAKTSSGSRLPTLPRKPSRSCPTTAPEDGVRCPARRHGPARCRAAAGEVTAQGRPEDRDVYITLSQMYSRLKRWQEAEEALDKAEQLSDQG